MVYKRISGDCPSCMTQVLIRNVDVNERTSRRGKFEPCLPPIQTGVSSIRYSNKLGSGLRQFRSSSLSNCFKQAIHVPPFYVDGFETRNGKLVYNVQKKIQFSYQDLTYLKVLLITSNAPLFSTIVYWFFRKVKWMNNK